MNASSAELAAVARAWTAALVAHGRPAERRAATRLAADRQLLAFRLRRMVRVLALLGDGRPPQGTLLDAGAGTAINAVLAVLAGASRVLAVDLNPTRLEVARALVRELGLETSVTVVEADLLRFEVPAATLAGVYSCEFLEHVPDSPAYHRLVAGWLAPGGRVYGRTGANGANHLYRLLQPLRYRSAERRTYAAARRAWIAQRHRDLPAPRLDALVAATRGYGGPALAEALARWQTSGQLPTPLAVPRHPPSGVYHERLRDPAELVAELTAAGLVPTLLPPDLANARPRQRIARWALRLLAPLIERLHPHSLAFAPWLEVLGERPRAATPSEAS